MASTTGWHIPPWHAPPWQSWPHDPQFAGSLSGVTHWPLHETCGGVQVPPLELLVELELLALLELLAELELLALVLELLALVAPPPPAELELLVPPPDPPAELELLVPSPPAPPVELELLVPLAPVVPLVVPAFPPGRLCPAAQAPDTTASPTTAPIHSRFMRGRG